MSEARRYLQSVGAEVKGAFDKDRTILSFEEYLDAFQRNPEDARRHARSAAQYLKDAIDHHGVEEVQTAAGKLRRFRCFDRADDSGEGRLFGQEEVQGEVYRVLESFVRSGRTHKLILLHGPNGSAKTTLVQSLQRALEDYSRRPEGARYRFNWVFPAEKLIKGSIGFGEGKTAGSNGQELDSYAHLEGESLDAVVPCDLKDTPLFLVPHAERRKLLLKHARPAEPGADDFVLSDYVAAGELCHKCQSIFTALLSSYQGDYLKVLRHVQVERFYVSRRYMVGSVSLEPQLSVDADFRQVTAGRAHAGLPPALSNLALYEAYGPLVAGNRGVIEFSDLLKRPLEAFKYLLGTSESGVVSLGHFLLHLDAVLIASSNEKHLASFKEIPDFASFKGRIELVRVPYLRRARVERAIYDAQVGRTAVGKHVAPHATEVAAIWAVLTRLKRPIAERYTGVAREIADGLTPLEKLRLYDTGEPPERLSLAQARELRASLDALYRESDAYPNYEGRSGASAREMKTVISNAAQNPDYRCLTPLAVLEELEHLVQDRSVYDFLQQDVVDGYHDHPAFVRVAEGEYLDTIDEEIRDAMGLVSEAQHRELFGRYVVHVSHWVKGERIRNKVTGEYEKPDEEMMAEVEGIVMGGEEERRDFRRSLISSIGAYKLDHPGDEMDYARIFPDLFRRLRDHYFDERRKTLRRGGENALRYLSGERASLQPKEATQVETMLAVLRDKYGYCEHCARDALLFLLRKRYSD